MSKHGYILYKEITVVIYTVVILIAHLLVVIKTNMFFMFC